MGQAISSWHGNKLDVTNVSTAKPSPEPPVWLGAWRPSEVVPATVAVVRQSLTWFQSALTPATGPEIMAALEPAIDLFGVPRGWEQQAPLYRQLLADLPGDLLRKGVFVAMRDGNWFPKPAEIRAPIREELQRRLHARRRLQTALMMAERAERLETRLGKPEAA